MHGVDLVFSIAGTLFVLVLIVIGSINLGDFVRNKTDNDTLGFLSFVSCICLLVAGIMVLILRITGAYK